MNNQFASIEIAKNKTIQPKTSQVDHRVKIALDAIFYSAVAYLFSCIWFDLLAKAVFLNYPLTYAWLPKLIITLLVLLIVNWPRIFGYGFLGLSAITILFGVVFAKSLGKPIFDFLKTHFSGSINSIKWAFNLDSQIENMPQFFPFYLAVLSILVALILIYIKPAPLVLTIVWILPYIIIVHLNQQNISIGTFFLGLFCILVTFARQSSHLYSWRKVWQIPPVALITFVLALVFLLQTVLPQNIFYNEKISKTLDQLIKSSQKMPDTVRYFEFSIKDAGYYPQDVRLGGPVELVDEPFMNVAGPGTPFYLRGTVFDQFEQNIWHASSMKSNYLFYNTDPIDQQTEAFAYPSSSKLPPGVIANYFVDERISISPIYQPIQAVFHGGKPIEIINHLTEQTVEDEGNNILYYFNPAGQIYASEQISSEGYSINGYISRLGMTANYLTLMQNDANVDNLVFAKQTVPNLANYQSFLNSNDPELAQIVYQDNLEENQKAGQLIEIINYLKNNYHYQLQVEEVPANQDFFEHFIKSKTGYCTYFATALTILAREAGFESRYVEGFLVQGIHDINLPQENYGRVVSTDQAHAWTEIKIDQLGWMPFDATPSSALNEMQTDLEKEEQLRAELPEPTEPEPTETEQTTLPTESQNLESEPTEHDQLADDQSKIILRKAILIILADLTFIAIIVIFILWRRKVYARRHNPEWLHDKFDGDLKAAVIYIWQDLKYLYKINDGIDEPDKTILRLFSTMLNDFNWNRKDTFSAYQAIEQVLYAEKDPKQENLVSLFKIYQQTEIITADNIPKLKWMFNRFLFSPEPKL
ncbi:MAG: transglutaminase domain-containing protein [Clostridiaceae bacterium]|jgi:hypothetical protein|nr:transglutaminase-like domain-containing protein [Bacillota bacterium]NLN51337.1 transglutaminase domain-containing protein [Clostridiaceae bacterium]